VRRETLPTSFSIDNGRRELGELCDPVQQDWLHTFNDPQLDALVQEAIAHNPDLRVAGARVEQAAQSLIIAQSAFAPPAGIFGTGGGKTGGGGDSSSALQAIMLFASWELDLWGRVRYARNAAEQDLLSVQADLNFARQSLAASVAKAWFTATQLTLNAGSRTDMVRSANQLTSLAQDRERVGVGTDAETAVAAATAKELEASQLADRARPHSGTAGARTAGGPLSRGGSASSRRLLAVPDRSRPDFRCRCWSGGRM
jgi:outer membrane protein TolC